MQRLFSTFLEGWPGFGILLMRLTVALSGIVQGMNALAGYHPQIVGLAMGLIEVLVSAALLFGFLTPIAGAFAMLGSFVTGVSCFLASGEKDKAVAYVYLAVISFAIALIGPGAFSVDARLFGRREIVIPESSRPPR